MDGLFETQTSEIIQASDLIKSLKVSWKKWETISQRPHTTKIPSRFSETFYEINKHKDFNEILMLIELAVFLPPHKNDTQDIGRVLSILKSSKKASLALSLKKSNEKKWLYNDDMIDTSSVAKIFHSSIADWSDADQKAASRLAKINDKELQEIYEKISYFLKNESLLPSEVMKNKKIWTKDINEIHKTTKTKNSNKKTVVKARRVHKTGQQATSKINDSLLQYDYESMKKYQKGEPLSTVLTYHHRKSVEFWQEVQELVDNDNYSTEEAFEEINLLFKEEK